MPAPRSHPRLAIVETVERLTPRMVRIVFGGDGLAGFGAGEFTDHYVKLQLSDGDRTRVRTYTVREWDGERLTIDFVVHGDVGVAGPWALAARPGDTLALLGPGGAYAPSPDADWHLMAGDPSVVPAIAASLARVPAGRRVDVLV
jgi:NADPH-dependent ferric siderophore reductase